MIKAEIWNGEKATLYGPFPFPFIKIVNTLSGRKVWKTTHSVNIEATPANLKRLRETDYEIEFIDKTGVLTEQEAIESMPTQHALPDPLEIEYTPGLPWYHHQSRCIKLSWFREWYAILFDVGLGKTAIIIATAGILFLSGRLTGLLVIAPKGPHRQWIEEELPKHIDKRIKWSGVLWRKRKIDDWHLREKRGLLTVFAMNTDAIRTKDGFASAIAFMNAHKGKVMLAVDEAQDFKGSKDSTERTFRLFKLKELAAFRRIATGTPIAKNIVDAWSQFNFLDERILGHKYLTSFKMRFCITSPHDRDKIVGQKNTEEFYSLIAPHSFRMTQREAVDLPPSIYVRREYEMGDETAKHYKELKETLLTEMADGGLVDAVNPAVALLRLQQVLCGFLPKKEDDEIGRDVKYRFGGERVREAMNIVRQVEGPVVIWCRFIEDRRQIEDALKKIGETYVIYGGSDNERAKAREAWLGEEARVFISNPRSGGVGLNLQGKCAAVIYYSNSFNALDRWQSEGRTMRIGTLGAVTYFDLVAVKTVDQTILNNLKRKKDLASLTLDDIRRAIQVEEAPITPEEMERTETFDAGMEAALYEG